MTKKKEMYFTDKHEKAIVQYIEEKNKKVKEDIYVNILRPVFIEMIEKIVYSFRFDRVLNNVPEHIEDCLSYLAINIHNFSDKKNSKAFSYFSVIIRNYFYNIIKKNVTKTRERLVEESENQIFERTPDPCMLEDEIENYQFKINLLHNIDLWISNRHSTEDDVKVLKAIKIIINTLDEYDCFNKKAFFLFIRDLSGLSTKQISASLKRIKVRYSIFMDNWAHGIKM